MPSSTYSFKFGAIECFPLSDGSFPCSPNWFF